MEFYGFTFIMFTGAAIALLGVIILMFAAFSTSAAWGIASLLIPPLSLGFALTHWSKGKNGFAITMIGLIVFSYGAWDQAQDKKINQDIAAQQEETRVVEPLTTSPVREVDPGKPGPETSSTSASPASPAAPSSPVAGDSTGITPTIVNMIDAHKFVDSEVRVTTNNGAVRTGILLEVNNDQIVLEYKPKGVDTVVKANINENDIQSIELIN